MQVTQRIPVAAVVGPTASGKSGLAVELALRRNGEIISADSMQIYKGMQIGTAKPTKEEMRGVPHYLIDCVEPSQPFSVADYVELASARIREIHFRGKLPIVAGGTGLYVRSLLQNINFSEEPENEALRRELTLRAENEGPQALLEELRAFDPECAARLHPNNLGRIIRGIEVYRLTGVTMTERQRRSRSEPSPYSVCMLGITFADRQSLYARINARVDEMLRMGLVEEARRVLLNGELPTARQAIGYKELAPYFAGECTLEEAVENIKRETRRYAKRQLTWFRREAGVHWLEADILGSFSALSQNALSVLDSYDFLKGECP